MTYAEQLRHPKWQRRRLEIMSRDEFRCTRCTADDKTLNVHHKLYRKGAAPWEYADDELKTLCEDCHGAEHSEPIAGATVARVARAMGLSYWLRQTAIEALWVALQSKACPAEVKEWWLAAHACSTDEQLLRMQAWENQDMWVRIGRVDAENREQQIQAARAAKAARRAEIEADGL